MIRVRQYNFHLKLALMFLYAVVLANSTTVIAQENVKPLDLSGEWIYLGDGVATIVQEGNRVRMKLTWTPSKIPGPHYDVDATLSGTVMTGIWRLICENDKSPTLLLRGRFEAEVRQDGDSIAVSNTEDNGHNWNSMVLTRDAPESRVSDLYFIKKNESGFEEIKEISYGEPFYIKAVFYSAPKEKKKTVILDWGEGADKQKKIIVNQQDNKKIFLSDTIYVKRPTKSGDPDSNTVPLPPSDVSAFSTND